MANMEGNDQVISGKRLLPIFGFGLIIFMVLGILITWLIGQAALPYFEKQAKERQAAAEQRAVESKAR